MLVAQAVAAEELFFGRPIPPTENERILNLLRQKTQNIVLIGMPGCGKSTVGQALAELTGRDAVDIDALIVQTAGKSIPDIFSQDGESVFRRLEQLAVAQVGKKSGKILICGGGVVKSAENYAPLHQNGRIYQITRDIDELSTEGRPLSQNANLVDLAAERAPLYAHFQDTIIRNDGTAADTAAAIWRDFCEHSGD